MSEICDCLGLFISDLIVFTDFNIESRSDVGERRRSISKRGASREIAVYGNIFSMRSNIFKCKQRIILENLVYPSEYFLFYLLYVFYSISFLEMNKILAITFYLCKNLARKIKFQMRRKGFVGFRSLDLSQPSRIHFWSIRKRIKSAKAQKTTPKKNLIFLVARWKNFEN